MDQILFNDRLEGLRIDLSKQARSLTRNGEDAKDLVQETIFKALKYREKYHDDINFGGWVFTIMRNTFLNQENRKKLVRFRSIDETPSLANSTSHALDTVTSDLGHQELKLLIIGLKENIRKHFTMSLSGFQYDEIAEEMGIPIGTVKSRIFKAREVLLRNQSR